MEPNAGNPELLALMRRQISTHGPVTFKWFMQQALYHPQFGYYGSGRARIGREGDFYTSVTVGRLFGELMAKQIEEMWLRMNAPGGFAIVEEGAHAGQFANDVLNWIQSFSPELYGSVKYWIVEPNPRLQQEQQAQLAAWPRNKVRWCESLASFEVGALCGVHVSNELLDAFPVHLVTWADGIWQENFIDLGRKEFRFVYGPPSNSLLRAQLERLPQPVAGAERIVYRTEVNLNALRWVEDIAKVLGQGYVLVVDYGYPRDVYYAPERSEGTLAGYREHQRTADPLLEVGESDLTAHVDFTSLAERAEASGLQVNGFCDQHHFMVGIGEQQLLAVERMLTDMTPELLHFLRSFKTLMHPSTMGMAFKFLCLQKNLPAETEPLSGFSRCGDGRAALGLSAMSPAMQSRLDDPYASF
jgi:SAM-dependent MidA family methyltransferase